MSNLLGPLVAATLTCAGAWLLWGPAAALFIFGVLNAVAVIRKYVALVKM